MMINSLRDTEVIKHYESAYEGHHLELDLMSDRKKKDDLFENPPLYFYPPNPGQHYTSPERNWQTIL